jgi:hypothetical protein
MNDSRASRRNVSNDGDLDEVLNAANGQLDETLLRAVDTEAGLEAVIVADPVALPIDAATSKQHESVKAGPPRRPAGDKMAYALLAIAALCFATAGAVISTFAQSRLIHGGTIAPAAQPAAHIYLGNLLPDGSRYVTREPMVLGEAIYPASLGLLLECGTRKIETTLTDTPYRRLTAVIGIPENDDRVVHYQLDIDHVTRAEGDVSSAAGPVVIDLPIHGSATISIEGDVVSESATDQGSACRPITLGIGNPSFTAGSR